MSRQFAAARERVVRICAAPSDDDRVLRAALLREIRAVVPFDSYVWVGTDPVTAVGASPLAEVPELADLPALIRLKYLTAVNRWTELPTGRVVTLVETTGDAPESSPLWDGLLRRYRVRDVASAVLRDRFGCWGFLDLWRGPGTTAFSVGERDFLGALLPVLATAVRAAVRATFGRPGGPPVPDGPAVLLLSDALEPLARTPEADAHLRALLPTPPGQPPVPAVALNVAAQLLAVEAGVSDGPPSARLHRGSGGWLAVRAARLDAPPGAAATIAVTLERAGLEQRLDVYCRAAALSPRETELVDLLAAGADTRAVGRALGITDHTVNDHLRSVFAKTGTHSRRRLIADATG